MKTKLNESELPSAPKKYDQKSHKKLSHQICILLSTGLDFIWNQPFENWTI
jgi:hypothetical protein